MLVRDEFVLPLNILNIELEIDSGKKLCRTNCADINNINNRFTEQTQSCDLIDMARVGYLQDSDEQLVSINTSINCQSALTCMVDPKK